MAATLSLALSSRVCSSAEGGDGVEERRREGKERRREGKERRREGKERRRKGKEKERRKEGKERRREGKERKRKLKNKPNLSRYTKAAVMCVTQQTSLEMLCDGMTA